MEGTQLGNYQLIARLGMGGMAEVFLARRSGIGGWTKYVALKRMRADLTAHQEFIDLFAEEAVTASLLTHPNICQVFEFNASDGEYYMVMEYLEGVPVSSVMIKSLRRPGWPPLPIAAAILEQACDGAHYAHDSRDEAGNPLNIVHRDISPPNLMLTSSGTIKLLDFGISKSKQSVVQTMTGQIRGKFSYMSPEQLQSKTLDRRSDVFSLGIVLYELVTGKRLFRRDSRLKVYHAITNEPIEPPSSYRADLPLELEAVIMRALAQDRNDRFETARDMADALRRSAESVDGVATTVELANFVTENFSAELENRRDLFTEPASQLESMVDEDSVDQGTSTVSLRKPRADTTEADATVPGDVPTHANTVNVAFETETGDSALLDGDDQQASSDGDTEASIDAPRTKLGVAVGKVLDPPKATDPTTEAVEPPGGGTTSK